MVGRIAYYYKEGYDVIVSGTKEDIGFRWELLNFCIYSVDV